MSPKARRRNRPSLLCAQSPLGALLASVALTACSGGASQDRPLVILPEDTGVQADAPLADDTGMGPENNGTDTGSVVPSTCEPARPSAYWTGERQVFSEVSRAWGLEDIGAGGGRIASVDFDGDGRGDLVVRRGGAGEDVWSEGGARSTWLLRNRGDGTFEDVTEASGFLARRDGQTDRGRAAEIVVWADVNNDGHLDAATLFSQTDRANLSPEGAEIMLGDGRGRFVPAPLSPQLHMGGQVVSRGGAAFVDVDRDGSVDLWVGHGSTPADGPTQDRLYRGDGAGAFADATTAMGLTTVPWLTVQAINEGRAHTNSWGVAACDLNNDGTPELLSSSYGRAPNHLWMGRLEGGQVRFENRSVASGYSFDGRTDWSDNESARCHCKLNPMAPGCEGVPAPRLIRCETPSDVFRWNHTNDREPFRLGGNSGTTVCADMNNDGWMDLLTTEIVHWDVGSSSDPSELLFNTREPDVRMERPGNETTGLVRTPAGRTWDNGDITAAVFDFDNDGRKDVLIASTDYPGTRAWLYHQKPEGRFEPVPLNLGIDLTSAHGVAVSDFDRDGDLDVVVGHSRNRCNLGSHCLEKGHVRLFENRIGQDGNWLQLQLTGGQGANRAAVGARVTVEADGMVQVHDVGGGHGHYGLQSDLVAHFGIGGACEARVTVRWPDAALTEQTFTIAAGRRYRVVQGQAPEGI